MSAAKDCYLCGAVDGQTNLYAPNAPPARIHPAVDLWADGGWRAMCEDCIRAGKHPPSKKTAFSAPLFNS